MLRVKFDCNDFPVGAKYQAKEVKKKLSDVFNEKCAYCETAHIKGEVEHFRPQHAYSWLVNDCKNLLWACHDCNNLKKDKLPVKEKKAVSPDSVEQCNEKEELIMINPAQSVFDKADLCFRQNGEIFSNNDLINNTIEICKLNRKNLIEARLTVFREFEDTILSMRKFVSKEEQLEFLNENLIKPIKDNKKIGFKAYRNFIVKNYLSAMLQSDKK